MDGRLRLKRPTLLQQNLQTMLLTSYINPDLQKTSRCSINVCNLVILSALAGTWDQHNTTPSRIVRISSQFLPNCFIFTLTELFFPSPVTSSFLSTGRILYRSISSFDLVLQIGPPNVHVRDLFLRSYFILEVSSRLSWYTADVALHAKDGG